MKDEDSAGARFGGSHALALFSFVFFGGGHFAAELCVDRLEFVGERRFRSNLCANGAAAGVCGRPAGSGIAIRV